MMPTNDQIEQCFIDGITQSEIMTRGNCIRKWMFKYILRLRKQGAFSWPLTFGGAVHKMLENYYELTRVNRELPLDVLIRCPDFEFPPDVILGPTEREEAKYWRDVAEILVQQHNLYYQNQDRKMNILSVERVMDYTYRGIRLRGIADLTYVPYEEDDNVYITDHKTTSDISDRLIGGFQFRFQFLFYAWLVKQLDGIRPAGFLVNAIKKPLERRSTRGAGESLEQFLRRIKNNVINEPQNYFRRVKIPLDDGTLKRFEQTILDPVITQFDWVKMIVEKEISFSPRLKEALLITANTDNCYSWNRPCEYLDLCTNNLEDFAGEYIQDKIKHPELPE